jgi:uncharacterized membrane protein
MKRSTIAALILIFISFAIATYLYPTMPERMASHWGFSGEANGYSSKFFVLFGLPILSVILLALLVWIPKLEPLKENVQKFEKYYDGFIVVFMSFFFYVYLLTVFWNLNMRFDMGMMLSPAFSLLFYYLGILIENSKRNWFIGIRTPWTMDNDIVWDKTHKRGGLLFKIVGGIALFGVIIPKYAIFFILVPVLIVSFYIVVYSYVEFKRQKMIKEQISIPLRTSVKVKSK